jgi:hypothetical protein
MQLAPPWRLARLLLAWPLDLCGRGFCDRFLIETHTNAHLIYFAFKAMGLSIGRPSISDSVRSASSLFI